MGLDFEVLGESLSNSRIGGDYYYSIFFLFFLFYSFFLFLLFDM
jgi:hypothetical protein